MNRNRLCGMLLVAIFAAVSVSHRAALGAENVPGDRMLPSGVLAYASFPNIAELKSRCSKSRFGQMSKDEALADFSAEIEAQFDKLSEKFEDHVGIPLNVLLSIPSGELSIAVIKPPGKKIGLVGILDFGKSKEMVDKLLDKAAENLEKKQATRKSVDFEGTEIIVLSLDSNGNENPGGDDDVKDGIDKKNEANNEVAYFVKDTFLVVGSSVSLLEDVVLRWDGKHARTFADGKVYRYIVDHTKEKNSTPLFTWYIDPVGIITTALQAAGQSNPQAPMIQMFLPLLGINNLKGIGGSMDLVTDDFDSVSRTLIYVDLPVSGLLKVFQFPAIEQSPPRWVSENVSTYSSANWNLVGAYEAIESLIDGFQGPGSFARMIDALSEVPDNAAKIHIKKDLVDQLAGKMHFIGEPPDAGAIASQKFLVALQAKNADGLKKLLAKVAEAPNFPGESRQFRGETIYELHAGAGAALGNANASMAIGVANNHLMLTSDVKMLEEVIRGDKDTKPLVESDVFKKIASRFPAATSILSFQRSDTQIQTIYDVLRAGTFNVFVPGIDFTKLPEFEAIRKYLPPTGGYFIPDENGALSVSFSLRSSTN